MTVVKAELEKALNEKLGDKIVRTNISYCFRGKNGDTSPIKEDIMLLAKYSGEVVEVTEENAREVQKVLHVLLKINRFGYSAIERIMYTLRPIVYHNKKAHFVEVREAISSFAPKEVIPGKKSVNYSEHSIPEQIYLAKEHNEEMEALERKNLIGLKENAEVLEVFRGEVVPIVKIHEALLEMAKSLPVGQDSAWENIVNYCMTPSNYLEFGWPKENFPYMRKKDEDKKFTDFYDFKISKLNAQNPLKFIFMKSLIKDEKKIKFPDLSIDELMTLVDLNAIDFRTHGNNKPGLIVKKRFLMDFKKHLSKNNSNCIEELCKSISVEVDGECLVLPYAIDCKFFELSCIDNSWGICDESKFIVNFCDKLAGHNSTKQNTIDFVKMIDAWTKRINERTCSIPESRINNDWHMNQSLNSFKYILYKYLPASTVKAMQNESA